MDHSEMLDRAVVALQLGIPLPIVRATYKELRIQDCDTTLLVELKSGATYVDRKRTIYKHQMRRDRSAELGGR